jgi:hypothetical protein
MKRNHFITATTALLAASTLACASFGQSKTSEVIYASLSEEAAASGDAEVIADAQQLDGADLDNGKPGRKAAICLKDYAKAARSKRELPATLEQEQAKLDAEPMSDKDKQRTMNIRRSARYNEVRGSYQSCAMSCKDATRAPDYAELATKYQARCGEEQVAASRGATYVRLEQRISAFEASSGLNAYYSANEMNGELSAAKKELPDDPKVAEYNARAEQLKSAREDELKRAHAFVNSPASQKNRSDYKTITADIAVIDANIKTWKNDRERVRALNESRAARQAKLRLLDDEFTRLCKEAKVCKN